MTVRALSDARNRRFHRFLPPFRARCTARDRNVWWSRVAWGAAAFLALWAVVGTAFVWMHRDQGVLTGYLSVAALLAAVTLIFFGSGYAISLVPLWLAPLVSTVLVIAVIGAALWHLRTRLPVMIELIVTFIRRGQWYVLPVVAGLVSLGGLLVVAASSPWLAPFIYTLF